MNSVFAMCRADFGQGPAPRSKCPYNQSPITNHQETDESTVCFSSARRLFVARYVWFARYVCTVVASHDHVIFYRYRGAQRWREEIWGENSNTILMGVAEELKAYRLKASRAKQQPAFCIFSNAVLDAIVAACPRSQPELFAIRGLGSSKIEEHGAAILRICSSGLPSSGCSTSARVSPYAAPAQAVPRHHGLASGMAASRAPILGLNTGPRQVTAHKMGVDRPSTAQADLNQGCVAQLQRVAASAGVVEKRIDVGELSNEQRIAASRALRGENLFITGAAGSETSHTKSQFVRRPFLAFKVLLSSLPLS